MHELGIAMEILALVRRYVPDSDAERVRDVTVRIGELSGVEPSSLDFCFGAAVGGTPWQQAVLVVTPVPAQAQCQACGVVTATATPGQGCEVCGHAHMVMVAGHELQVVSVDLADADDALTAESDEAALDACDEEEAVA